MSWLHAARTRVRLLFARRAAESRMEEEFRFHLEMEAERLVREQGLDAAEARRRAFVAFGGVEQHKEALRDDRGLAWLGGLRLDLKLGVRMLVKYPGLTLVGGLAMAFAIWVGAVTFEMVTLFLNPSLPLPGGDRIVQMRNWDAEASAAEPRVLHDFVAWRESLRSVTDLGAYRDITVNLIARAGDARPVQVAEITASGFHIASEAPLLGRALTAADERAGAPPVVVLGYDVWRTRFDGAPNVLGRSVQLGDAFATVVGVMPEGFAFPVAHDLWTPLRVDVLDQAPRSGPDLSVFGRLAPGVSLEVARAELSALGRRMATEFPKTHEHLQPRVWPYAEPFPDPASSDWGLMASIPVFGALLLVLVCGNVALLIFARAATRESELIVRSALGATRRRIVAQLFAEALVLGALAAVVGLATADLGLRRWGAAFLVANLGRLPFWFDVRLSPTTMLYAVGLTLLGAAIAGAVPALKVTRALGSRLRQGSAGGGGLRFGGVWTAVIVTQVAFTAAFPAVAFIEQQELRRIQSFDPGFPAEQYLAVRLEMDGVAGSGAHKNDEAARAAQRVRFTNALDELRQRVAAEPGVAGVTFVDRLPRTAHVERPVEVDDRTAVGAQPPAVAPSASQDPAPWASTAMVDPSYFDVLEAPILAGRGFHSSDLAPDARVVIVDQGFVDEVLRGRSALGRRLRFVERSTGDGSSADEPGPWYQIVGVVEKLGMRAGTQRDSAAGVYLPAVPGSTGPINMVVHVNGDPLSLGPKVRALATAADPTLRLSDFQRVDQVTNIMLWIIRLWLRMTGLLTAIALLLSLAGIYAVMSFTVSRRTREIGIRVALGANARSVVASIFRRPLTQVGIGVAAGGALAGLLILAATSCQDGDCAAAGAVSASRVALLVLYSAVILGVCLLACIVPTRRALRVEPSEALRAE
jgi:putative ABC transport system permease protein